MMICRKCEYYELCRENEFKHKITKMNLPVFSRVVEQTLKVFNEIKCGIIYTKEDFAKLPNKVAELLVPLTNAINNKQNKDLSDRQNKAKS